MVITVVAFGARGQMTPASVGEARSPWARQPDGKLIAAGATEALNGRVVFALARFLPGWRLDHSFGRDGAVATDFDGSVAYASALQPDGKVVAAGMTGPGDLAAAKLPSSPWRVIYPIGVWTAASESAES